MQTNKIYALYDRKAGYYLPIFQMRGDTDAIRQFSEIVNQSDTPVSKYPADYDLVSVGYIDMETGQIEPTYPCETLINGFVALQNAQLERSRYAKALNGQVDLEDLLAEQS